MTLIMTRTYAFTYLTYLCTYVPTYVSSYVVSHVYSYVRTYVAVYVCTYLPLYVRTLSCVQCVRQVISCWSVSLLPPRSHSFCLCTGEVPCVVSCVSGGLSCWSVTLLPRSHFSVIPRSTLALPPCVKIWQTSVAPSKISHLLCCLLQQRSHMAQK